MYKIKAGISINPEDHFYNIVPFIPEVELIQIYTIMPGAQGQPFLPERLKLIPLLRQFGFTGLIGIDGGVNLKTISLIKEYQPDILSVGSAIMHAEDPVAAYKELLEALRK
jgi:ribulose-phosphate 3-epimerase